MSNFTPNDRKEMLISYRNIIINLKEYLKKEYNISDELDYSKIIINMLHIGDLSVRRNFQVNNNYDYLALPSEISQGVQIMYGVGCCRHATYFLFDVLRFMEQNPYLLYIYIDEKSDWKIINPITEKANHVVILLNGVIIDPINKTILKEKNSKLEYLNTLANFSIRPYEDPEIYTVKKILDKYYKIKKLGINNVYTYNF